MKLLTAMVLFAGITSAVAETNSIKAVSAKAATVNPEKNTVTEIVEASIETNLVPSPRGYRVLLPKGGDQRDLPLLLFLHGGGGSSEFLVQMKVVFERAFQLGVLPPLVVATLDAERSFYLDYADGSQKWETFILTEWLPHLRATLPVAGGQANTLIAGISMGGHGTARIGLRHPRAFRAMAAMEPAVMPALKMPDIPARNLEFQSAEVLSERYGSPPDAYWNKSNPAQIVQHNAHAIRDSGIRIYLEVGTEDFLLLNEGTEFLHQQLLENGIQHEYRLVLGANHVGNSITPRTLDMLAFLGRAMSEPEPDPMLDAIMKARSSSSAD